MKKITILACLVLAFAIGGIAFAAVVSYDYPAATNGAAYTVPQAWTPATATAYGVAETVTVKRIHGSYTNDLGTVAPTALNAAVSWGALVPGDTLVITGEGLVEIQGTK